MYICIIRIDCQADIALIAATAKSVVRQHGGARHVGDTSPCSSLQHLEESARFCEEEEKEEDGFSRCFQH